MFGKELDKDTENQINDTENQINQNLADLNEYISEFDQQFAKGQLSQEEYNASYAEIQAQIQKNNDLMNELREWQSEVLEWQSEVLKEEEQKKKRKKLDMGAIALLVIVAIGGFLFGGIDYFKYVFLPTLGLVISYFIFKIIWLSFTNEETRENIFAAAFVVIFLGIFALLIYGFVKGIEVPSLFFVSFALISILFIAPIVAGISLSFGWLTKENIPPFPSILIAMGTNFCVMPLVSIAFLSLLTQYFVEFSIWLEYGDANAAVWPIEISNFNIDWDAIFDSKKNNIHCLLMGCTSFENWFISNANISSYAGINQVLTFLLAESTRWIIIIAGFFAHNFKDPSDDLFS